MFYIKIDNGVDEEESNQELLYSTAVIDQLNGYNAYDILMTSEIGNSGTLNFIIPKGNPAYDLLRPLGTSVYLYRDSNVIWFGRILTIDKSMELYKSVSCEGALAFLNDIVVRPIVYYGDNPARSASDHLNYILSEYNKRCSKKRHLEVSYNLPQSWSDVSYCSYDGIDSWSTVSDAVKSVLEIDPDVFIYAHTLDARPTIVIGTLPGNTITVPLQFGKNIVDMSVEQKGSDICTSVIPLGKDNISMDGIFKTTGMEGTYGYIEKTYSLSSIDDKEMLEDAADILVSELAKKQFPDLEIQAVDLYSYCQVSGISPTEINLGTAVPIKSPLWAHDISAYYVCHKISMTIGELENTSYTFKYIDQSSMPPMP